MKPESKMVKARSRRVQAQRKFAQGAYVPPNVVAVVAADNRRDAAQDPRNVTINNMTATGLLDVVALQSHSRLISQPVVIVEKLRGRNLTRDVLPPPSQRDTLETRPWEYPHERVNNNVATIKKPAEPPNLLTVKKKKEYKKEHPMALRTRRPSKLQINRLIAESCSPLRHVTSKRKKQHSSDEDEPLIFQKIRLIKQIAARESAKENILKPSSPKEKSPKNKPCKKRSKKEITTSEVTTHETITKTSKTTTKKFTTNEISLKESDRRNAKQSIARKTPMKQKRIHKKCSPKQPEHVAPECSVPEFSIPEFTITVIKEDITDEMDIKDDEENLGTPDGESVIEFVPNDPLSPDDLDDIEGPFVPIAWDDLPEPEIIPMECDESPEDLDLVMSDLDQVFESKKCIVLSNVHEPKVNDTAQNCLKELEVCMIPVPENPVPEGGPDEKPLILHNKPINDHVPELLNDQSLISYNVQSLEDDQSVILHSVPMPQNCVPFDPVDKLSSHDTPMVNNDLPVILHDVKIIDDDDLEPMNYDACLDDTDDKPVIYVDLTKDSDLPIDYVPEHTSNVTNDNIPEETGDPDVPLNWEDAMDSPIMKIETVSPGVAAEQRSSDADVQVLMDFMENTAAHYERTQNVQLETPGPCAAVGCRSDKDVINASMEFLASSCKLCKPCIRIDKLMKVSALLESQMGLSSKGRQNKTAVQENEPTEREGETEDIEIDYEDASSTDEDPGTIYLLIPNQSSIMIKLRANKLHGKDVLGVGLVPKNESLINKEFSLEEHEPLLDQIIENLSIYPDVNFEGRDVNLLSRGVKLAGREVNSEVRDDNTVLPHRTSEDRNDDVEGRNDHTECPNDDTEGLNDQAEILNTKGQNDNLGKQNDILDSRKVSRSSDSAAELSDAEMSDVVTDDNRTPIRLTAEKRRLKRVDVKKKLAEMHDRMKEEKEREIARVQEEKRQEILRLTAEKDVAVAQMSRYHDRCNEMERQKNIDFAYFSVKIREEMESKLESDRQMYNETDGIAANLDNEKDAKKMYPEELSDEDAPGTSSSYLPSDGGLLVDAPVYHPNEEDFRDPLEFYEKIWPEAVRFGICKVVPPPGWQPPFRVHDEMRFDVMNQYISRLFSRWGPAARELCAIKLCLAQQKVNFTRPPVLDGVEVNLPKLYHLVQRHGGLETVYNKKRWGKVAEDMKFNKGTVTEKKLDHIYVKYLLPYDTLSHQERQDIMRKVEIAWNRKNQKLLDRALNPLNRQQRLLGLIESSDDETEDEETMTAVNEAEDCIMKGAVMNCAKFKKIATMTYENTFGPGSEAAKPPDLSKIEEDYWRLVTHGTEHVCVHTAAIDTGEEGYGFTKNNSDCYGLHPWNPKMVSQNQRNVLQYLGQMLGVTMPTLLLGMLFSTSCWHKDPHAVAWLEYQLSGPERIWYGIPADQADKFRKAVETLCPTSCQNKFHWLSTDITMIPPSLLREHNVTLSRVTQRDGEYILAFPNAYTCCISTGYTESESVYFAPPSWLESLWKVFKEARESCEPTMFAMEHLLYNIGKDPNVDPTILKIAQPIFDKMLREEVTNRQMLQERGLPFEQDLLSASFSRKKSTANPSNPRDQDECEYCRATLYLSKVTGLTGRNTFLCLEHALKLLDTDKYKHADVNELQVLVHVSVKELNTVHDDMKRRLGLRTA